MTNVERHTTADISDVIVGDGASLVVTQTSVEFSSGGDGADALQLSLKTARASSDKVPGHNHVSEPGLN